jgi:hypothetical protein
VHWHRHLLPTEWIHALVEEIVLAIRFRVAAIHANGPRRLLFFLPKKSSIGFLTIRTFTGLPSGRFSDGIEFTSKFWPGASPVGREDREKGGAEATGVAETTGGAERTGVAAETGVPEATSITDEGVKSEEIPGAATVGPECRNLHVGPRLHLPNRIEYSTQFGLGVTAFGVPFAVENPLASACGSVAVAVTACENLHGFLRHWPFLKSKHRIALAGILAGLLASFFFGAPPTKAFFVETCWRTKKDRESMPCCASGRQGSRNLFPCVSFKRKKFLS